MIRMIHTGPLVFSAALVLAGATPSQKLLFTFQGKTSGSNFGWMAQGAGDIDRDGFPDLLIASPSWKNYGVGKVDIISGKDGRVGLTLSGVLKGTWFGYAVDVGGDANADGFDDILVGAPKGNTNRTGQVFVFSGKDGRLMREINGTFKNGHFGSVVRWLGDVNRDGKDDLLIGEPLYAPTNYVGRAHVFSGVDGKLLYTIDEKTVNEGSYIEDPGDLNKDGYADFLVVSGQPSMPGGSTYANIYSGKDGKRIWRSPTVKMILGVLRLGDVSADGTDDFLITDEQRVHCFSGKDGKTLYTVSDTGRWGIGYPLCRLGDIDKDGLPDFAAGASYDSNKKRAAYVGVYSGKTGKVVYKIPAGQSYPRPSNAGDIDRDGTDDLIFHTSLGTAHVFSAARTVSPFKTFGSACTSRPLPPTLRVIQEPRIGRDFVLEVGNMTTGALGGLIVGFSDQTWQGRPLPVDLAPIGMKGCKLWVSWFATIPMWSGGGAWRWKIGVPFDYTLIGAPFFLQSYVRDVNANTLGVGTSTGGRAIVGT